jgi:outer membrane protein assembly factor BamB
MVIAAAPAAAAGHRTLWTADYGGGTPADEAGALGEAVSPDSATVYVAGYTGYNSQLGASGGATLAYNARTGATRWTAVTPSTSTDAIVPTKVAVSHNGATVFAAGYYSGSASGAVAIAYNAATGASLWMQRVPNADSPILAAVSPDGSRLLVVTQTWAILAFDTANGKLLFASSPLNSLATAAALSPDGSTIFITGSAQTAAYDASTGALLWAQHYPARTSLVNGTSLAVSPDGSTVYVAGTDGRHLSKHGAVAAYNSATGTIRWVTTLWLVSGGSAIATEPAVGVSPDGATLFVAGAGRDSQGNPEWVTQGRAAATGAPLWTRRHTTTAPETETTPANLAVSPGGTAVYVTGDVDSAQDGTSSETVAYNAATGARLWMDDSGAGPATTVSPDGSAVFVASTIELGTQTEFFTTAVRA